MIVREAYRAVEHAVCRDHYHGHKPLPTDAPVLGQVQDARDDVPCEFCPDDIEPDSQRTRDADHHLEQWKERRYEPID